LDRLVVVVTNLKPAKMRGILSSGMVLCGCSEEKVELLSPPIGSRIGEAILVEGLGNPQPDEILKTKSAQEMYKRVSACLTINDLREGCYKDQKLLSSKGVCTTKSLKNSALR
jgi:tRNA-binding EMAP/Myf-like protein